MRETPEGFLICYNVPITRTGDLIYGEGETPLETDDDGEVLVSRDADDVFDDATMASFVGKPITITHPEDFVTPDNWKELAKGTIQNVRRGKEKNEDGEEEMIADLLITDAVAIGLIKRGLREVSCGYEAEYVQTGKGKGRQKKIIGNHLALVDKGRATGSCVIHDHERKGIKMSKKLAERIKAYFGKAVDEAVKQEKKTTKKPAAKTADKKTKQKAKDNSKEESEDSSAYDELKAMHDEMGKKLDAMKPESKDDDEEESEEDESHDDDEEGSKEDESKDDDEEEATIESRVTAIEKMLKTLMKEEESESHDDDEEESEESKDEDEDDKETHDDDEEEKKEKKEKATDSDTLARAEILSPGIKDSKDIKTKALKKAYDTKDGKKVIDSITGKSKLTMDGNVDLIFRAASDLLKQKRKQELAGSKKDNTNDNQTQSDEASASKGLSPEQMNALNEKLYNKK